MHKHHVEYQPELTLSVCLMWQAKRFMTDLSQVCLFLLLNFTIENEITYTVSINQYRFLWKGVTPSKSNSLKGLGFLIIHAFQFKTDSIN